MTIRHYAAFAASAALIAGAATAADGGRKLQTALTGAAEVPGPGDTDGTGTADITVNAGQNQVCYKLSVSNIAPANAAHIHEAAPTAAGPVVITLGAPTSGTSSGCVTVTRELALEILKRPADYYVNVHNPAFPAGAVRGQLAK
ncbi:MAG: CHRD domain-containing protein [Sphingomonas bacterium]|nr:CHRD domain-containing protein [Sphingomonas bacterium]